MSMKNIDRELNSVIIDPVLEDKPVPVDPKTEIVEKIDPENEIDPVKIARELQQKLADYSDNKEMGRKEILNHLSSMFLASRIKSSTLVEKAREKAITALLDKMDSMTPAQLIRAVETLSKLGEADAFIFSGSGGKPGMGGTSVNIFNNGMMPNGDGNASHEGGRPQDGVEVKEIKKANSVLNAMTYITGAFSKAQASPELKDVSPQGKIIDVTSDNKNE